MFPHVAPKVILKSPKMNSKVSESKFQVTPGDPKWPPSDAKRFEAIPKGPYVAPK